MNPAPCETRFTKRVKETIEQIESFMREEGISFDRNTVDCEVLVKRNRVIGCKIRFTIEQLTEENLSRIVGFVELAGYGEVQFNGPMTWAMVVLSPTFE